MVPKLKRDNGINKKTFLSTSQTQEYVRRDKNDSFGNSLPLIFRYSRRRDQEREKIRNNSAPFLPKSVSTAPVANPDAVYGESVNKSAPDGRRFLGETSLMASTVKKQLRPKSIKDFWDSYPSSLNVKSTKLCRDIDSLAIEIVRMSNEQNLPVVLPDISLPSELF